MNRSNLRAPKGRHINKILEGLRLVALDSNGLEDDGAAKMQIKARMQTFKTLSSLHRAGLGTADHYIRELQHKWLVSVVVVLRDIHGNLDNRAEHFILYGMRINAASEDIQPKLDAIKHKYNERMIVDWGWIAEILPADTKEHQLEALQHRADEWLLDLIEERHTTGEHCEKERRADIYATVG